MTVFDTDIYIHMYHHHDFVLTFMFVVCFVSLRTTVNVTVTHLFYVVPCLMILTVSILFAFFILFVCFAVLFRMDLGDSASRQKSPLGSSPPGLFDANRLFGTWG